MDINQLLRLAVRAGQIILENGGETYRTEETIGKILENKVDRVETFVTPTGIFISIEKGEVTLSAIKGIQNRRIDLNKVAQVNDLARKMAGEKEVDCHHYQEKLPWIAQGRKYSPLLKLLAARAACSSVSLMIGGKIENTFPVLINSILLQAFILWLEHTSLSIFMIAILGGAFAATGGLVLSPFWDGLDRIIISSIMVLLPGVTIINAVRDAISGDLLSGISRGVESLIIVLGITLGVGAVLNLWMWTKGGCSCSSSSFPP